MADDKQSKHVPNGGDAVRTKGQNSIQDGLKHAPGGGDALINLTDAVLLFLDHQSGLFQVVGDISVAELRANTTMLAKLATLMKVPVITTASIPEGPNGPLMPEIHQFAPHASIQWGHQTKP